MTCRQRQLSHEVGTPLNAILGNVELMLDGSAGPLSAQALDCLADIQVAGQNLLRQSRMLLLLVQALEAPELENEPLSLKRLFEDAFRHALPAAPADQLLVDEGAAASWLVGDPFWLQTLARCVIDVYASGEHEGPLRVALKAPAEVRIEWPGFTQADVPATAVGLMRRIVEMHGGRMLGTLNNAFILSWPTARLVTADDLEPRPL